MWGKSIFKTLWVTSALLALTACEPGPVQTTEAPPLLSNAAPFNGELTTSSPINVNDGSRYEWVSVALPAGEVTRIEMGGPLQGRLALFQDGRMLAVSQPVCCNPEARSGRPYVLARGEEGAQYQLGVSGLNSNSFGPYSLRASTSDIRDGGPLGAGDTLKGWLNGVSGTAEYGHVYDVKVSQAAGYEFTLRSSDFDAFLTLTGAGQEWSNDDGAGGADARLTVFLEPGDYKVKATALGGRDSGMYTLSSVVSDVPLSDGGEIRAGHAADIFLRSGTKDNYRLVVEQARRYVIDLESDHFDALLMIKGPDLETGDDDGGNNFNARLELDLEPGIYDLTAMAVNEGGGSYRLTVQ